MKKLSFFPEIFGIILVSLGVLGLAATAVISMVDIDKVTNGSIPAISFLVLVLGMTFAFPSLLQEEKGSVSTMRVVVLTVVLVFATVYIKLGWIAGNFESFSIHQSWVYILGLAFGSKAFQKFAENDDTGK